MALAYLALLSIRSTRDEVEALARRLKLSNDDTSMLLETNELGSAMSTLADAELSRSDIYRLLSPYSDEVIFICWLASDDKLVKERLQLYHGELAFIEPLVDGDDLKAMGLPPGPKYAEILRELRDARLDGKVKTLDEEQALVHQMMARRNKAGKRGA